MPELRKHNPDLVWCDEHVGWFSGYCGPCYDRQRQDALQAAVRAKAEAAARPADRAGALERLQGRSPAPVDAVPPAVSTTRQRHPATNASLKERGRANVGEDGWHSFADPDVIRIGWGKATNR